MKKPFKILILILLISRISAAGIDCQVTQDQNQYTIECQDETNEEKNLCCNLFDDENNIDVETWGTCSDRPKHEGFIVCEKLAKGKCYIKIGSQLKKPFKKYHIEAFTKKEKKLEFVWKSNSFMIFGQDCTNATMAKSPECRKKNYRIFSIENPFVKTNLNSLDDCVFEAKENHQNISYISWNQEEKKCFFSQENSPVFCQKNGFETAKLENCEYCKKVENEDCLVENSSLKHIEQSFSTSYLSNCFSKARIKGLGYFSFNKQTKNCSISKNAEKCQNEGFSTIKTDCVKVKVDVKIGLGKLNDLATVNQKMFVICFDFF